MSLNSWANMRNNLQAGNTKPHETQSCVKQTQELISRKKPKINEPKQTMYSEWVKTWLNNKIKMTAQSRKTASVVYSKHT